MEATVSRPRHRERPPSFLDEDIQEEEETVAPSTTERRGFNDPDLVERVKTLEVINDDPSRNQEEEEEEDRDIRDSTKPSYLNLENIRSLGDNSPKNERVPESKYPRVTKIPQSMVPQVIQQQQQQYAYIIQDPQMSQPVYDLYSNNSYFSTQPYPLTINDQSILSPSAPPLSLPPSRPHSPPSFHKIFLQGGQGNGAAPIGTTNPAPQAKRPMDAQEPVERFSRYISMFDCPFCLKNLSADEPVVSLGCCKRPYHLNCAGSRSQWFAFNSKPGTVQRSFCPYCTRPDTDEDRIISNIKKKRRAMEKVAEEAITSLFHDNDKQLKVFDIIGEALSTSSPTYSFELLKQLKIPFVNKFSWSFKFGGTGGGKSGDDKATESRLEFDDDTGVPKEEADSGGAQQQQSIPQPAAPQSSGGNSDDPSVQVIHILKRIDERRKMIEKRVSGGRITSLERRIFDSFLNSNPIEPLQTLLSKKSSGNWLGPDGSSRITYRGLVDNGVGLGKLLSWGFCLSTLELELGMTEGREDLEYGGFEPSMLKTMGDEILALHERYRIDADYLLERFHITVEQLAALELHSTSLAILGFTTHKLCLMGMVKTHIPLMNIHLERWIETLCMRKEHIFILDINGRDLIRGEGVLYSSTWNMDSIMKRFNLTFHESEFLGFPEATRREHEIEAAAAASAKAAALEAEVSKRAGIRDPNPVSEQQRSYEMRHQHLEICPPYSPQPPAAAREQQVAVNHRYYSQPSQNQPIPPQQQQQQHYRQYDQVTAMRPRPRRPPMAAGNPHRNMLMDPRNTQQHMTSATQFLPSQRATANRRPSPSITLGEYSVSSLSYRPNKDALPQMYIPGAKMSVKNRFH